jgi:transcriptional regulator with XRE-family HTH domain
MAANLSQEELAEAASISASAIGAYERGVRTVPHRETVALLAAALGLNGSDRTEFELAARSGRPAIAKLEPSSRKDNLPAETTLFVGRENELAEIADLLQRHRVVTLTGAGGIGRPV